MRFVLVVHHDADLYGADQSLLRTLRALKASAFTPLVVVPHDGPLVPLMRAEGAEVHIGPVVKLTRQKLKPTALPKLLLEVVASLRFLSKVVNGRPMALAYTNSVSALGGAVWAALRRVPRLWHVREIVVAPRLAAVGFPALLRGLGGWCVCNSLATRRWITEHQPELSARSSTLWNGLEPIGKPAPADVAAFRDKLGLRPEHLVVTLVGRINRWKGQGVFIEAAKLLKDKGHGQLRLLIVGDVADDQHHFREAMLQQIRDLGVQDMVLWHPFTPQVHVVWAASDIAAAPSTDPEPFGRVAIEAMAHSLPVIAAGHGGLAEIVVDGETGLLVQPGSAPALAQAIERLAVDPDLRQRQGAAGLLRQQQHFTQSQHDTALLALMGRLARP